MLNLTVLLVLLSIIDVYSYQNAKVSTKISLLHKIYDIHKFALSSSLLDMLPMLKPKGSSNAKLEDKKAALKEYLVKCQPNGIFATQEQRSEVDRLTKELEKLNPTRDPAYSSKMNGFWRLLYSDFNPPAPSSGKLGPFVGEVYQDLDSTKKEIINILRVPFPKIEGGLVAKQSIRDKQTWQIEFQRVGNSIFGIPLKGKVFPEGKEIRLWKITYLDDDFRVLRARRPETPESESFIFILKKDDAKRFSVKI